MKVEPHWGETYPMIAGYGNIDYVCVAVATDAQR